MSVAAPPASEYPPPASAARPAPVTPTPARSSLLERHLVLTVTLLALGLRLYRLAALSMWLDEAGRVEIARLGLGGVVKGVAVLELCPPLYHALAALWLGLAGDGDFAIRLFSTVAGVMAIPLSWAVARRLLGQGPAFAGRTVSLPGGHTLTGAGGLGLGAALAAAISPFYVFYAQEAAQYSLLLLLSLLHVYLLLRLLDGEDRRRDRWAALLATTVAGLYTQYYFGFLLAGEGLAVLIAAITARRWRLLGWWVGAMVLAGLAFLPWLPYLQRQAQLAASNSGWGYPAPFDAATTVWTMNWLGFDTRLPAWLTLVACLPPLLLGLWHARHQPARLLLMACLVAVPFALAVGSAVVFHSFRERGFLIVAFIPYTLLGAGAAGRTSPPTPPQRGEGSTGSSLGGRLPSPRWGGVGGEVLPANLLSLLPTVAALAMMGVALTNQYRFVEKENWRDAAAWVQAEERPGDGIFFIHYGMQVPFDRYYRGQAAQYGLPFDFDWDEGYYKRNVFNPLDVPNSLGPAAARHERVWLVLSHDAARGSNVAISYLDRTLRRADGHEYLGVRVFRYERAGEAGR